MSTYTTALDSALVDHDTKLEQQSAKLSEHDSLFDSQGQRISNMANDFGKLTTVVASDGGNIQDLQSRVRTIETASTTGSSNPLQNCIDLATIGGANDEERKNNGIAESKKTGKPMVLPDGRQFEINTPFVMWGAGGADGAFRLFGASPTGTQNLEQGTKKVRSWIKCGSGIGMDDKAVFVNPGTIFDFFLSDFAVEGGKGTGQNKQLWYGPYSQGRNAYRGSFRNIAMNFMASGFGTDSQPAAFTATGWHGQFEYLNCWAGFGGFLNIGGSDCFGNFHLNCGPSASPLQAGRVDASGNRLDWLINIINLSKTKFFCNMFGTANNGWGALRIRGQKRYCYDLHIHGAVLEGYKPTGSKESGPSHGTLVRIEDGAGSLGELGIGQGMASPTATEKSVLEVHGGDWAISNVTLYKGDGATTPDSRYIPYYAPAARVQTWGFTSRDLPSL